jgi:hypothetical protein
MSGEELEHDVLRYVEMDRRAFVKRIVAGTAFAVPVVASFSMDALASTHVVTPGLVSNTTQSGMSTNQALPPNQALPSNQAQGALPSNQAKTKPKRTKQPHNALVGPQGDVLISGITGLKLAYKKAPAGAGAVVGTAIVKGPNSVIPKLNSKTPRTLTVTFDVVVKGKLTHYYFVLHDSVFTGRKRVAANGNSAKVKATLTFKWLEGGTY